jgi:hypothetical protein
LQRADWTSIEGRLIEGYCWKGLTESTRLIVCAGFKKVIDWSLQYLIRQLILSTEANAVVPEGYVPGGRSHAYGVGQNSVDGQANAG